MNLIYGELLADGFGPTWHLPGEPLITFHLSVAAVKGSFLYKSYIDLLWNTKGTCWIDLWDYELNCTVRMNDLPCPQMWFPQIAMAQKMWRNWKKMCTHNSMKKQLLLLLLYSSIRITLIICNEIDIADLDNMVLFYDTGHDWNKQSLTLSLCLVPSIDQRPENTILLNSHSFWCLWA